MDRRIARTAMVSVGSLVALIVFASLALPLGEVVTLEIEGPEGQASETQLWVVDVDGHSYLRGGADSHWIERVRANPAVWLVWEDREPERQAYRAVEVRDRKLRGDVDRAMAEKYGFTDRLIGWFGDRENSAVLRLDPRAEAGLPPRALH